MPAPNLNNPLCEYCSKPMSSNGAQKSGATVYRCRRGCKNENGKTPTITMSVRRRGRPTKGAIAMTQAQSDKQYRENNPEKYREIHKKKRKKRKDNGYQ